VAHTKNNNHPRLEAYFVDTRRLWTKQNCKIPLSNDMRHHANDALRSAPDISLKITILKNDFR